MRQKSLNFSMHSVVTVPNIRWYRWIWPAHTARRFFFYLSSTLSFTVAYSQDEKRTWHCINHRAAAPDKFYAYTEKSDTWRHFSHLSVPTPTAETRSNVYCSVSPIQTTGISSRHTNTITPTWFMRVLMLPQQIVPATNPQQMEPMEFEHCRGSCLFVCLSVSPSYIPCIVRKQLNLLSTGIYNVVIQLEFRRDLWLVANGLVSQILAKF